MNSNLHYACLCSFPTSKQEEEVAAFVCGSVLNNHVQLNNTYLYL